MGSDPIVSLGAREKKTLHYIVHCLTEGVLHALLCCFGEFCHVRFGEERRRRERGGMAIAAPRILGTRNSIQSRDSPMRRFLFSYILPHTDLRRPSQLAEIVHIHVDEIITARRGSLALIFIDRTVVDASLLKAE